MLISLFVRLFFTLFEVLALIIVVIVYNFSIFVVSGTSMEPGLCEGDYVVAMNANFKIPIVDYFFNISSFVKKNFLTLRRGDIVILDNDGRLVMKRIIAIENDSLVINRGIISINGISEYKSLSYCKSCALEVIDMSRFIIIKDIDDFDYASCIVPAGYIFCIGDNRACSLDSRSVGFYKEDDIVYIPVFKLMNIKTTSAGFSTFLKNKTLSD